MADADEVLVYTPDAPISELPEAFKGWTFVTETDGTLGFYGLYNVNEELGWRQSNSYD